MRNLLGRLHARNSPELLRIATAWSVPAHADNKGELVAALYRAMSDPSVMRDVWTGLDPSARAMLLLMAESPDPMATPTLGELAARLGVNEDETRETALGLYRSGFLAREGDDEPLPIGVLPRLLLPRELALNIRRMQDEIAAGDLTGRPLRVLVELLDDPELEDAMRIWGLHPLPGVAPRDELVSGLLRVAGDRNRIGRVERNLSRDAAVLWQAVRSAPGPLALTAAFARAGLGGAGVQAGARRRLALAELEASLLAWHSFRPDGSRWLFVPSEIREPATSTSPVLPALVGSERYESLPVPWRHADAVAWDLLSVMRALADSHAPAWEPGAPPPRWLARTLHHKLWIGSGDGPPEGYLELLQALGMAEGILAVNQERVPHRVILGPQARAWRAESFAVQSQRLRDRWLRLPTWVEGNPANLVDVRGADWRGFRPRLLAALVSETVGATVDTWVTLESLSLRIASAFPSLIGRSFIAATARQAAASALGASDPAERIAVLGDVVALELSGAFCWFGLTESASGPGMPPLVRLTAAGAALATRKPLAADEAPDDDTAPIAISPSGEITLRVPSPGRVWGLGAIAETVALGPECHYRLTAASVAHAVGTGIEPDQIVTFLEQGSRRALSPEITARLREWATAARHVLLSRAVLVQAGDAAKCAAVAQSLAAAGWFTQPASGQTLLVLVSAHTGSEDELSAVLRNAGYVPQWTADADAEMLVSEHTGRQLVLTAAADEVS